MTFFIAVMCLPLFGCQRTEVQDRSESGSLRGSLLPGTVGPKESEHPKISRLLSPFLDIGEENRQIFEHRARQLGFHLDDGQWLLQIRMAEGFTPEDLTDQELSLFGARALTRGIHVLDVEIPIENLVKCVEGYPEIAFVRKPSRPRPHLGAVLTQGAEDIGAFDFHNENIRGRNVKIAIFDYGFEDLDDRIEEEELAELERHFEDDEDDENHGTLVAEVISDLAPESALYLFDIDTRARMESALKFLADSDIDIVNHSGGWVVGWGDGSGWLCELVDEVVETGITWVNSGGNNAQGFHYMATYQPFADSEWHRFAAGQGGNSFFAARGETISISLVWDQFPRATDDMDLHLYRVPFFGEIREVASSTEYQDGTLPPIEEIEYEVENGGWFMASVRRDSGDSEEVNFRLISFDHGMEFFMDEYSITDPASCMNTIAVAAIPSEQYSTGPQAWYSSIGPTLDGRIKPNLSSPTDVDVVGDSFGGTSAAAPHVAGSIALYMEVLETDSASAMDAILEDVIPIGDESPNTTYGLGRLMLSTERIDYSCKPGQRRECSSYCDFEGEQFCIDEDTWGDCEPLDENACLPDSYESCETESGSEGERLCSSECEWQECIAVGEGDSGVPDSDVIDAGPDSGMPDGDVVSDGDMGADTFGPVDRSGRGGCGCRSGGDQPGERVSLFVVFLFALLGMTALRKKG